VEEIKLCKRGHTRTNDNLTQSGGCKECIKILRVDHNYTAGITPEKRKQYRENAARENPDAKKEANRKYYERNIHKERARSKRNYRPDKAAEATRKWREENPLRLLELQRSARKNLTPGYVAKAGFGCKKNEIPEEFLDLYRLKITLQRELRKCKASRPLPTSA